MAYETNFLGVHYLNAAPVLTTTTTKTTKVITTESAPVTRVHVPAPTTYVAPVSRAYVPLQTTYLTPVVANPVVVAAPRVLTPALGCTVTLPITSTPISYW